MSRTVFVNGAPTLLVKEDAVLVFLFDEADRPTPHDARVIFAELGLREIETVSKNNDLLIADAHGTGESGAAASAPQAFESESVFIPEIITHKMIPLDLKKLFAD